MYSKDDLINDEELELKVLHCEKLQNEGVEHATKSMRNRAGNNPIYLSIDIDVLDSAYDPGTRTLKKVGMTSMELLVVLRGLAVLNVISPDVAEVDLAYDHAELTSLVAATTVFELIYLLAHYPK